MKKLWKSGLLVVFIIGLAVFAYYRSFELTVYSTALSGVSANPDLSFSVISDIHTNISNMKEAIEELHWLNPKQDALILNGDTVDQGIDSEYKKIKASLDKYKDMLPNIIIKNIGNHEFFDYKNGPLAPYQIKAYINRYLNFSGGKGVYHDTWIKGYHFISLGTESGSTKELGAVKAYISKEQLDWLEKKLAENYVKGKPIFVFLHQNLNATTRGLTGTNQAKEIDAILSKYKEAVLFTSHTHVSLNVNNVFTNRPYTQINTGAVSYQLVPDGKGGVTKQKGNQGIYVEVKGNKVIVKGREFKDKRWIFSRELRIKS